MEHEKLIAHLSRLSEEDTITGLRKSTTATDISSGTMS